MNPILKFVILFEEDSGYGYQEIHYLQAGSENPNLVTAMSNFVAGVVTARAGISGKGCNVVGARVSYKVTGAIRSYAIRQFMPGYASQPGSAPALSLAMLAYNADGTRKKVIHVRGFWDAVESDAGYDPALAPGWDTRLNAYKTALTEGLYGWPTKDSTTSSSGDVNGYIVNADGTITFTVLPLTNALPAVNTIWQVRFSRLNNGKSVLNRSLLVKVASPTTLTTVQKVATAAFIAAGKYNLRITTFVRMISFGSISLGERRMGRPLNRYPGRAPARALS